MKYTAEEVRAIAKRLHDDITVADGDALMASDMLNAYAERIKADEEADDYPDCSGDPSSCPENEGRGCCKPNPSVQAAQDALDEARDTAITDVFDAEHPCTTAGRVVEWMPIETAPRDVEILVFVPDSGEQFVAYWHKRFGAWVYAATTSGVRVFTKDATHWMPLPPPPTDRRTPEVE